MAIRRVFHSEEANALLYQADCIELMDDLIKQWPEGGFDLIVADPPALPQDGMRSGQVSGQDEAGHGRVDHSARAMAMHKYHLAWLSRCRTLLKRDGTIWVSGTGPAIYSVGFAMHCLGMKLLNDVTWKIANPPRRLGVPRCFTRTSETLLWAAKTADSEQTYNHELMRKDQDGKLMNTVWSIKLPEKSEQAFGRHPEQKPLALLDWIILSCSQENDWVFDPFAGSATTGVAAIGHKRHFIGCESQDSYINIAKKRLEHRIRSQENEPGL